MNKNQVDRITGITNASEWIIVVIVKTIPIAVFVANIGLIFLVASALSSIHNMNFWQFFGLAAMGSLINIYTAHMRLEAIEDGIITKTERIKIGALFVFAVALQIVLIGFGVSADGFAAFSPNKFLTVVNIVLGMVCDFLVASHVITTITKVVNVAKASTTSTTPTPPTPPTPSTTSTPAASTTTSSIVPVPTNPNPGNV